MKRCQKCKLEKNISEFCKDVLRKDGVYPYCKSCTRDKQKFYLRKIRSAALEALGGECIKCGFNDKRALQIDHINGGGSKERKKRNHTGTFHKHVLRSFLNKENKYQLLCANCNWIKRFENNEIIIKKKLWQM